MAEGGLSHAGEPYINKLGDMFKASDVEVVLEPNSFFKKGQKQTRHGGKNSRRLILKITHASVLSLAVSLYVILVAHRGS